MAITLLIMLPIAYLFGSINAAIVICKIWQLDDPRTAGSQNPGATNVYRMGGAIPASLVLVFDVLKGTIPVWSSYFLGATPLLLGFIAVAACLGHIYPIFFQFRGGKGVATAFGALLPIGLDLAGLLVCTWLLLFGITRFSSLAAIVTVTLAPIFTFFIKPLYAIPVVFLTAVILFRHRENIARLRDGTEPKV